MVNPFDPNNRLYLTLSGVFGTEVSNVDFSNTKETPSEVDLWLGQAGVGLGVNYRFLPNEIELGLLFRAAKFWAWQPTNVKFNSVEPETHANQGPVDENGKPVDANGQPVEIVKDNDGNQCRADRIYFGKCTDTIDKTLPGDSNIDASGFALSLAVFADFPLNATPEEYADLFFRVAIAYRYLNMDLSGRYPVNNANEFHPQWMPELSDFTAHQIGLIIGGRYATRYLDYGLELYLYPEFSNFLGKVTYQDREGPSHTPVESSTIGAQFVITPHPERNFSRITYPEPQITYYERVDGGFRAPEVIDPNVKRLLEAYQIWLTQHASAVKDLGIFDLLDVEAVELSDDGRTWHVYAAPYSKQVNFDADKELAGLQHGAIPAGQHHVYLFANTTNPTDPKNPQSYQYGAFTLDRSAPVTIEEWKGAIKAEEEQPIATALRVIQQYTEKAPAKWETNRPWPPEAAKNKNRKYKDDGAEIRNFLTPTLGNTVEDTACDGVLTRIGMKDKADRDRAIEFANQLAPAMKADPSLTVEVHGHASPDGPRLKQFNMDLSRQRANVIKALLVAKGVNADQIIVVPHGDNDPVEKQRRQSTKDWKLACQRVEFVVKKDNQVLQTGDALTTSGGTITIPPKKDVPMYAKDGKEGFLIGQMVIPLDNKGNVVADPQITKVEKVRILTIRFVGDDKKYLTETQWEVISDVVTTNVPDSLKLKTTREEHRMMFETDRGSSSYEYNLTHDFTDNITPYSFITLAEGFVDAVEDEDMGDAEKYKESLEGDSNYNDEEFLVGRIETIEAAIARVEFLLARHEDFDPTRPNANAANPDLDTEDGRRMQEYNEMRAKLTGAKDKLEAYLAALKKSLQGFVDEEETAARPVGTRPHAAAAPTPDAADDADDDSTPAVPPPPPIPAARPTPPAKGDSDTAPLVPGGIPAAEVL